jgi:hypothetical protein
MAAALTWLAAPRAVTEVSGSGDHASEERPIAEKTSRIACVLGAAMLGIMMMTTGCGSSDAGDEDVGQQTQSLTLTAPGIL